MNVKKIVPTTLVLVVAGCAVISTPPQTVEAQNSRAQQIKAQQQIVVETAAKTLKRKIAIGRFSNETRYGRTFQTDANLDPLGKQVSDMLANRLGASHKFLLLERPDLVKIQSEQKLLGQSGSSADLVGVDALILGSVTEFGRSTTGKSGFLSSTKIQTARAKVEIRLVDARTGLVFFSTSGVGEASTEAGEVAGFGSHADYDSTLNDRAISAAISDVQNALIAKLEERPWRTDILKTEGNLVFIAGGARQGLKVGDVLAVLREGQKIKSAQSGFDITLPGSAVGKLRVKSLFGDSESNEGAVAELISGSAASVKGTQLFVAESAGQ
ncbi:curli production assembly protein CsgG [Glaciimonas sp. PCH181]|nr:curli production assembly protein CsgG [Glaciimonas sp. PCH181]